MYMIEPACGACGQTYDSFVESLSVHVTNRLFYIVASGNQSV